MRQNNVLGDGESQAGATGFAGTGLIHTVETLKQAGKMLGRDAGPEVLHVELDAATGIAWPEHNLLARGGVLESVFNQVGKDLVDGFPIGLHGPIKSRVLLQ